MNKSRYHVVKCNECGTPMHVAPERMPVPSRFILTCACGHLYEYFIGDAEVMEMEFKPVRDLPVESKEGDLERIIEEQKQRHVT